MALRNAIERFLLTNKVRVPGQRRLRFDMDMALLRLRGDIGDVEPVMRLAATDHKLLRRWAET
jgi:PKHD-type hydroxylase